MSARVTLQRLDVGLAIELVGSGKAAAKAALREAVLGTPAGDGNARANWQVGRGSAPEGLLADKDPDGLDTVSKGEAVIDAAEAGEALVIANNLDTIAALNDGHLGAAPGGFAERALAAARRVAG